MGTWIQLISLSAGLLGLLALLLGLRGRRVGTAPHCRTCRFDLTGLYPEHETCPECGADLTGPRATTQGLRRRSWKLAIVGLLIFAIPATLGVLAAQGLITKAKIAEALPTGALIALTIDRPDSWIAPAGRDELLSRLPYSPAEHDAMANALIRALGRPDFPEFRYHSDLLGFIVSSPSTPSTVRRRYADFLLDRVVRTDAPWVGSWGTDLLELRAGGAIDDDTWNDVITKLITPRLWCSSGGGVQSGERFVLRVDLLSDRIQRAPGAFVLRIESLTHATHPQSTPPVPPTFWRGEGLPWCSEMLDQLLVAGPDAWAGDFAVRTWYAESVTDLDSIPRREGLSVPGTLTAEARLPLEVRPALPSPQPPQEPPSIEAWLRSNLLPALSMGTNSALPLGRRGLGTVAGLPTFHCCIAVLAPPGELSLRGTLRTITPTGKQTELGTFDLAFDEEGGLATWTSPRLAAPDIPHHSMKLLPRRLAQFRVAFPAECLLPQTTTRAVLLFDHVTLPDGRTFDAESSGTAPIEIEFPLDPDTGNFHW
ncbi:MAG: hypothetical protein ACF8R9_13765 [Phycisphaerales bacterium JB054]